MNAIRFYELDGEQKLEVLSKMVDIISMENLQLPCDESRLKIEIEQGYDPAQDFNITLLDDETKVELRQFV